MQKRVLSYILILAICLLVMPFTLQIKTTYAASSKKIVMTVGETKTITIPKKRKYYTSSESNGCISSTAKYKSRKVKITALEAGTSTLTITTTNKKKHKYTITVKAKPADKTTEEPQSVAGACPHCKRKGRLKTAQVTYDRKAVKTGYLKEPLISGCEFRRMHFSDKLTETEIQALVKSWHGVILSKFSDKTWSTEDSDFGYDIVVPCEYSGLNNVSSYQNRLAQAKGFMSAYDMIEDSSVCDFTQNYSHYLTEWTIEDVVVEPAKQATKNTGVTQCTYCGYKFMK